MHLLSILDMDLINLQYQSRCQFRSRLDENLHNLTPPYYKNARILRLLHFTEFIEAVTFVTKI